MKPETTQGVIEILLTLAVIAAFGYAEYAHDGSVAAMAFAAILTAWKGMPAIIGRKQEVQPGPSSPPDQAP